MTDPDVDRARQLLAEGTALRRLACSLLGDHADAEDLVQDALVASLRSPCVDAGKLPWLSGTLRNLALLWRRTATRRAARETLAAAARPAHASDPAEIAAEAEAMRVIAAAVHELAEPFRTVVVMRYWRGLLPEAIAQQLGVPRNTVRSRLQRGLDRLRGRLGDHFGDRRSWLAALTPCAAPGRHVADAAFAAPGATTATKALGVFLMTKLHVALATAALAAVGILLWSLDRSAAAPPPLHAGDGGPVAAEDAAATAATTPVGTIAAAGGGATSADRQAAEPVVSLTVLGSVTNAGAPCPDVALTVQWFDGGEATGAPAAEHDVRSDAAGQFVWRGPVRTTTGTVRAVRAGPAGAARISCTPQLVPAGQTEVELAVTVLPLDRTLFGRVHDVRGAPIAGAELTVNGWRDVATFSDADGRYELQVTGPPYPLLVHKTGYRERLLDSYVADGTQRTELDIELAPGAVFTGRVVDEAGNPVAGATLTASGLTRGTATDAAGHFAFGGAAPEENHGITVTKTGFQPTTTFARAGGAPLEIVLRPGLAVALRVVGSDGAGLAGVRVGVRRDRFEPMGNRGATDAEGRLRLVDLPAKTVDVLADKEGFVSARSEVDVANQRGELVLVLRPGRTIAGRVLDSKGQPVVGASVYCQLATADGEPRTVGSRVTSDPAGRFTIRELPPEPCEVRAHHADFRRASLPAVAGTPTDLVVRMEPAASVAGRVVDAVTGAPVPAFTITLAADPDVHPLQYVDAGKFAGGDGWWRIRHWQLQPGAPLFLDVAAAGYAPLRVPATAQVDAGRDQHVIRLSAGTTVRGVVRDAATNAAVPQVEIVLQSGDPMDSTRRDYVTATPDGPNKTVVFTDAEGRFELRCVPPGENRLVLAHAAYPKRTFGPFEVTAGVPVVELQPTLAHGATLRGRVTGVPDIAGKQLTVGTFGGRAIDSVLGADGSFEVRGVGQGQVSLALTPAKGMWHTLRLDIGDDDVSDIVFAVPPPGTGAIRATVTGLPRGRGAVAMLGVPKGQCATVRTFEFADGAFVVESLSPGRYEVEAYPLDGGGVGRTEITVGSGDVAVIVDVVRR